MEAVARGTLRIYLGAAPGVGKTFAMLGEAHRRRSRGTDIVVGLVETHGRRRTAEQLEGLEVLPRREVTHRGVTLTELDVDAVLARHPEVVVVDELAHTNAPGSKNPKRWQDVDEILDAGIHVLTTVNIEHLESLNDVVEQITGIAQQETVPDAVVRRADQIELVDMTPEALRRRLAHGNVYPAERVDAALGNYFRLGNLTALRELALLWLADRVDEGLRRYRAEHHIDRVWEARERVVVALTGGAEGETLVRRASRVAQRSGGELLAVHVLASDGLTGALAGRAAHPAGAGGEPGRQLPRGRRRRRRAGAAGVRPQRQRHPAGDRHQPPLPVGPRRAPGHRRPGRRRLRRDRRAHRHPLGGRLAGLAAAAADRCAHSPPALGWGRCSPWSACRFSPPSAWPQRLRCPSCSWPFSCWCWPSPSSAACGPRWGPRCSAGWWRTGSSCLPRGS